MKKQDPNSSFEADLKVIAFILQEAATQNELLSHSELIFTRFHSLSPPNITIFDYLVHLKDKTGCSRACFVIALIYLDRLLSTSSSIQITPNTIHKLFLAGILVASKFCTDFFYDNSVWAGYGGVRTEELNILEREFLFILHFSLVIDQEEYKKYDEEIRKKAEMNFFVKELPNEK